MLFNLLRDQSAGDDFSTTTFFDRGRPPTEKKHPIPVAENENDVCAATASAETCFEAEIRTSAIWIDTTQSYERG